MPNQLHGAVINKHYSSLLSFLFFYFWGQGICLIVSKKIGLKNTLLHPCILPQIYHWNTRNRGGSDSEIERDVAKRSSTWGNKWFLCYESMQILEHCHWLDPNDQILEHCYRFPPSLRMWFLNMSSWITFLFLFVKSKRLTQKSMVSNSRSCLIQTLESWKEVITFSFPFEIDAIQTEP